MENRPPPPVHSKVVRTVVPLPLDRGSPKERVKAERARDLRMVQAGSLSPGAGSACLLARGMITQRGPAPRSTQWAPSLLAGPPARPIGAMVHQTGTVAMPVGILGRVPTTITGSVQCGLMPRQPGMPVVVTPGVQSRVLLPDSQPPSLVLQRQHRPECKVCRPPAVELQPPVPINSLVQTRGVRIPLEQVLANQVSTREVREPGWESTQGDCQRATIGQCCRRRIWGLADLQDIQWK